MILTKVRTAILAAFCFTVAPVLAQKPVVGAVVNAANYAVPTYALGGLAPNSLASIFGQHLASVTKSASALPLPNTLGGTTVMVNGVAAPLLYVSSGQINFQVPTAAFEVYSASAPVIVETAAGTSDPFIARIGTDIGIFTIDASACGRGAVFNVAANGSVSLNSPSNSVSPGGIVTVWGTGYGVVPGTPPDGEPSPFNPPAQNMQGVNYLLPIPSPGSETTYLRSFLFAGKAPGLVGVDQFNIDLPDNSPEGCSVPLILLAPAGAVTSTSQPVPVSIHRGGGQCVDPAPDSIALLTWTRTVIVGTPGSTETLSIEFKSRIGLTTPTPLAQVGGCLQEVPVPPAGPRCSWAEDKHLDAGVLIAQGPVYGPVQIPPTIVDGQPEYNLNLPSGTVRAGIFTIAGQGGRDVGPFTTTITIPEPIQPTTPVADLVTRYRVAAAWMGGTAADDVRLLTEVAPAFEAEQSLSECAQPANSGTVVINRGGDIPSTPGPGDALLIHTAGQAGVQRFSASGLTLGGRHTWKFEFKFNGLTFF